MVARIGVAALFSPFYVSTQRQNSTSLLTLTSDMFAHNLVCNFAHKFWTSLITAYMCTLVHVVDTDLFNVIFRYFSL